ncbi:MAG: gas vesicle protein [Parcubacteria group bacterium]|nr:gas vesicle protein [Parcubacteria group bacterium]
MSEETQQSKKNFHNQSLKGKQASNGVSKFPAGQASRKTLHDSAPAVEQNSLKSIGQANGIFKAVEFIKETLGKEGSIVKANKIDKGWEVEVEVVEQSEYMKRIGILKPVYDKNVYRVTLDQDGEMVSYERKSQKPSGGPTE